MIDVFIEGEFIIQRGEKWTNCGVEFLDGSEELFSS